MKTLAKNISALLGAMLLMTGASTASAACVDSVVLVHGNAGSPSNWNNTYNYLRGKGYSSSQIHRPKYGSLNPALNNHSGSEEYPVRDAIKKAISTSCTGKIDVIGHSLGVTLAAQQIIKTGNVGKVDAFVGIAGAYRGLWSCGVYPANVWTPTCGRDGLSISSPFLDWLYGRKIANRTYSIKSWVDQLTCSTGTCRVGGVHTSQIKGERASYSYGYGHFGLQKYTASKQYSLIK
ncbi:MAG: lipase [Cellvibrionaceae bacterium]